jgi:hypothetical protein
VTLEVIEGGDHSLRVAASAAPDGKARSEPDVIEGLRPRVRAWIDSI